MNGPEVDTSVPSIDNKAWTIDFDDLEIGREIGSGGFGKVYRGEYLGAPVAIKRVHIAPDDPNRKDLEKFLNREIETIKLFSHPNVIQFIGIAAHQGDLFLVTELVVGGDLQWYLKNRAVEIPWILRLNIAYDVTLAMSYLHSKSIVHRDLKSSNLLIDPNWKVKVCDFGFARIVDDENNKSMTICGTDNWMAPEMILGEDYDEMCDVFSFGLILFELITRNKPTPSMRNGDFSINLEMLLAQVPNDCPTPFTQLMLNCIKGEPVDRPSFKHISLTIKTMRTNLYGVVRPSSIAYPPLRSFNSVPIQNFNSVTQPPIPESPTKGLIADAKKIISTRGRSGSLDGAVHPEEEEEEEEEEKENENQEEGSNYESSVDQFNLSNSNGKDEHQHEEEQQEQQEGSDEEDDGYDKVQESGEDEQEDDEEQQEFSNQHQIASPISSAFYSSSTTDSPNKTKKNVSFANQKSIHRYEKPSDDEEEDDDDMYDNEYYDGEDDDDDEEDYDEDDDEDEYDYGEEDEEDEDAIYRQRAQQIYNQNQIYQNEEEDDSDDRLSDDSDEHVQPPVHVEEYNSEDDEVSSLVEQEGVVQPTIQLTQVVEQEPTQVQDEIKLDDDDDSESSQDEQDEEQEKQTDIKVQEEQQTQTTSIAISSTQQEEEEQEQEPVAIVEPTPVSVEEPTKVEEPVTVVEEPTPVAVVEEPTPVEEPVTVVEEPTPVEEPTKVEEPVTVIEEPTKVEDPTPVVVVEEPTKVEEPVAVVEESTPVTVVEEPTKVPEPVAVVEEPTPVEEPTKVPEPIAVVEEPIPEPVKVQEPVKIEEPVKVQEPVKVVEQPPVSPKPKSKEQPTTNINPTISTTTTSSPKVQSATATTTTQPSSRTNSNEKAPLISNKVQRNCCNCFVIS
ncbi:LISK family protein kinase [Cavenderia fasciculata]|uniref:non-specific serine/threonine protein kinase n=1 Tax=Cavenderia fasciculata TaxID=261658 RepID=F4Q536_CACFS|nr:LISK family protein kinase [Cavenderia fasciculata]EGG17929.1 LISK family protein kinase [Cavenderia fasciculata]|eukprot:XP_004356413.1 LISK family protein kinase [Cavenderia fasciculata]